MKNFIIFLIIIGFFIGAIIILSNDLFKDKSNTNLTQKQENKIETGDNITETKETENTITSQETSEVVKEMVFVLYFSDENAMYLVKEERKLEVPAKIDIIDEVKIVFEELINGSKKEGYFTEIPDGTRILSAEINLRSLILNLSEEFQTNHSGGSTGIAMSFGPIVLSMTELNGIDMVKFLINGNVVGDFKGHITLIEPFSKGDFQNLIRE